MNNVLNIVFLTLCIIGLIPPPSATALPCNFYEMPYDDDYYPSAEKTGGWLDTFLHDSSAHIDLLYWKAKEDGLALGNEVCISREGLNEQTGIYANLNKKSKLKVPEFCYDPGFRVGFVCAPSSHCWNFHFDWIHFNAEAFVHGKSFIDPVMEEAGSYVAFIPFWETLAQNFPDLAKGTWNLHLDLFDFELGRDYPLSSQFSVRPHFGVRCARINQKYHVASSTTGRTGDYNGASYDYTSDVEAKCNFLGAGPRLGFDADLKLCWGLSLFGKAAGALIYGNFNSHSHEFFKNTDFYYYNFDTFQSRAENGNSKTASRAMTDLAIGIKWDRTYSWGYREVPFYIAVSWEHHYFHRFNNFKTDGDSFTNVEDNAFNFGPYANLLSDREERVGDLFLQGLTVAFGIDF